MVLYIDFTRHKIWREKDSWYRNLKQPPIQVNDAIVPVMFVVFLFPTGLPLAEAYDRGELFEGLFGFYCCTVVALTVLSGFVLFVWRSPARLVALEAVLVVLEYLKMERLHTYGAFYIFCSYFAFVAYVYTTINTTWLVLINPGYDYFPEEDKERVE